MKQLIKTKYWKPLWIAFLMFLFSCGSNDSSKPQIDGDSTSVAPVDTIAKVDSALHIKENIAFGNINFGISRHQYDDLIKNETQEVVSYKYSFKPYFTELDQLYGLDLSGSKFDNWDSAVIKLNALESKIFQFYPTCDFANRHFGVHNAISDRMQISREWKIGKKKIVTGIYTKDLDLNDIENDKDNLTVCRISNEGYLDSVRIHKDKTLDSAVNRSPEIRTIIYTTNIIESFHSQLRKITKTKRVFHSDQSLLKLLYLVFQNNKQGWIGPIQGWKKINAQLAIIFEERINQP